MDRKENPHIGLGTAAIGRPQYINIRDRKAEFESLEQFRQKGSAVLEEAWRRGVRYFDTAPGYGMAEDLLASWIKEKNDPEIQAATKWGYTYVANFDPNAIQHEVKEHSLTKLNEQWEASKKLLPWLKIYQIHSATFDTGVLENREIHHRLAEIRDEFDVEIGLSASGVDQVAIVQAALAIEVGGKALFEAFQLTYNIFDQSISELAEHIHTKNKKLIIKEALANGRIFPNKQYPHYTAHYELLNSLAKKHQTGVDAIALRFCMDSLQPFQVLSGAARTDHIAANLKAQNFQLTEEEIAAFRTLIVEPYTYWTERNALSWN